jgi:hypothetical protein
VEQQNYKICIALLKPADAYSAERLEGACEKAPVYHESPSFKSIKTILKTGSDKRAHEINARVNPVKDTRQYAFTRGKAYYAGGKNHGE